MSYTTQLKDELIHLRKVSKNFKNQQAYGLILFSRAYSVEDMHILTKMRKVAELYAAFIAELIPISGTITTTEEAGVAGERLYTVRADDRHDRYNLLNHFNMLYPEGVSFDLLGGEEGTAAFLNGAFLACGRITEPEKKYHLEFSLPRKELFEPLKLMLEEVGFRPACVMRRGLPVIYFRESGQIEDLLTFMGCPKLSMEIMGVKILKERRNAANRAFNCDRANINKQMNAAQKQIAQIQALGIENLPEELRDFARLRLDNPHDSLRELGEKSSPPLTRSGVNHRLAKIAALAESMGLTENTERG